MTLSQVLLKQFESQPGEFLFGCLMSCFGLMFLFVVGLVALRLLFGGCSGGYEEDDDDDPDTRTMEGTYP